MTARGSARLVTVAAWLFAAVVIAGLVVVRLRALLLDPTGVGYDFRSYFLPAARAVAAGRSPYEVPGYVYSPLVALGLAPFAELPGVFLGWSVAMLACAVLAVVAVTAAVAPTLRSWQRPLLAAGAAVTLLWNWPVTLDLFLGQSDLAVLAALAAASWAAARRRTAVAGVLPVVAALVKTWPAVVALWVLRRGTRRTRFRAVVAMAATAAVVLVAVVVAWGPSALRRWVGATVGASDQSLVTWSAWGVGRHLFGAGGAVPPLATSPALAAVATGFTLALAVGVIVVTLLRPPPGQLGLWHLALATVLVLPVSHLAYLVLGLPIGWLWAARWLRRRGRRVRDWVVLACYAVWWWATFRTVWPGDSTVSTSTTGLIAVLGTSFLLLVVSTAAAALPVRRRAQTTSWSQRTEAPSPA